MNISFYLNRPEDEQTSVMAYITFNGIRIRCSTGLFIVPGQWNQNKQNVRGVSSEALKQNNHLANFKKMIQEEYYSTIGLNVNVIKDHLSAKIRDFIAPPSKEIKSIKKVLEYFDEFIDVRAKDKQTYRFGTIKVYKSTRLRLKEYLELHNLTLSPDEIDKTFYVKFSNHLSDIGIMDNSIGKHMKTLKTFLRHCLDNNYTSNLDFIKFKAKNIEPETMALTQEELDAIAQIDYEDNRTMDQARDMFLIQCYTGVRFSDLKNIRPENINLKEGTISIITVKTEDKVIIPLHGKLKEILFKYKKMDLPNLNNIVQNRLIKKVARKAGITELVSKKYYQQGEQKSEPIEKCELITTHSARRSFVSILLKRGALPEMVMAISGHRDRRSFQRYVRIAQNVSVKEIRNIWDEVK